MILDLTVAVSVIIILQVRRWTPWFQSFSLELITLIWCALLLASLTFGGRWYAALLFGKDPIETFGSEAPASEGIVVLAVAAVSTGVCLLVPVRSHLAWIVPTVGLISFSIVSFAAASPFPAQLPTLFSYLFHLLGIVMLGGFRNEMHTREKWLALRNLKKQKCLSEKQHEGFSHLLKRLCDCLLHLGPDFEILEPSPNLTAMLFLADGKRLQGNCFCDYLASEEDQARFVAAMGRGSSEEEPAGILPVHLKDAQSREVQVHAYYTCFHDEDGSPYYLVGIVEAGGRAEKAEQVGALEGLRNDPASIGRASSSSGESGEKNAHSESELTLESVKGSDLGAISITFDDFDGLRVISCTPGFTALCGPVRNGMQLKDWIVDSDEFEGFIQGHVNRFVGSQHFEDLVLRMPSAASAGIEYVIHKVTVEQITDGGDANLRDGRFTLSVRLDDIEQRVQRRIPKRHWHGYRRGTMQGKAAVTLAL